MVVVEVVLHNQKNRLDKAVEEEAETDNLLNRVDMVQVVLVVQVDFLALVQLEWCLQDRHLRVSVVAFFSTATFVANVATAATSSAAATTAFSAFIAATSIVATAATSSRRSLRFCGISIHTDSHIAFENTCRC
jgi:hypothetical protein